MASSFLSTMPAAGPSFTLILTFLWAHVAWFAACSVLSWAYLTNVPNLVKYIAPRPMGKIMLSLLLTGSFFLFDSFYGLWTNEEQWRVDAVDAVVYNRQQTIYVGSCMQAFSIVVVFMQLCFFNALYFFA